MPWPLDDQTHKSAMLDGRYRHGDIGEYFAAVYACVMHRQPKQNIYCPPHILPLSRTYMQYSDYYEWHLSYRRMFKCCTTTNMPAIECARSHINTHNHGHGHKER